MIYMRICEIFNIYRKMWEERFVGNVIRIRISQERSLYLKKSPIDDKFTEWKDFSQNYCLSKVTRKTVDA
jgi:hypothetical protein